MKFHLDYFYMLVIGALMVAASVTSGLLCYSNGYNLGGVGYFKVF